MQIILHIGAHKTASTHLQLALAHRRGALGRGGTALFLPGDLRKDGLRLQNYLGLEPSAASAAEHGAQIRAAFATAARWADRLVVSDENILGALYNPGVFREGTLYAHAGARLALLAATLPDGPVTVALALRNPAGYLTSVYSQWLMSGRVMPFDRFLGAVDPAALRWSGLVERLIDAMPGLRLAVWRYEDYPAVAPAVLRGLLSEGASLVRLAQPRAHPGLSARAHAAVMDECRAFMMADRDHVASRVQALREAYPKGAVYPAFHPFDQDTLARTTASYDTDCAEIARMDRVTALW
ncbi:MAG: hypothetical protein HLUCCA12_05465 [Rhodobacteraceae bacterium HLUCCA12]|nr:MAG: hypothetical protein HLUCCA12_05465 [Rhodobacteraceae bacterium HLUCCA12]